MQGGTTSGHEDEELLLALDRQAAEGDAGIDTLGGTAVIMPAGHNGVAVIVRVLQLGHLPPCAVVVEAWCFALGEFVLLSLPSHLEDGVTHEPGHLMDAEGMVAVFALVVLLLHGLVNLQLLLDGELTPDGLAGRVCRTQVFRVAAALDHSFHGHHLADGEGHVLLLTGDVTAGMELDTFLVVVVEHDAEVVLNLD